MLLYGLFVALVGVTPVSLEVDLSRPTLERVGKRLEASMQQRLAEDGFPVEKGAKLKLHVEQLHGHFRLSARVGDEVLERDFTPTGSAWREELMLELAQRVVMLAHEAEPVALEAAAKVAATPSVPTEPEPQPEPTPVSGDPLPMKPPPPNADDTWRVGAGVRAGVSLRFPAVDPSIGFHGAMTGLAVQPMAYFGAVFSPGTGLFAFEVPLTVGVRVPISLSERFSLTPELLVGPKLHVFWEDGGPPDLRVDAFGSLGLMFAVQLEKLRVGLRLAGELSVARTHLLGSQTLWSRSPFGLSLQLVLERS